MEGLPASLLEEMNKPEVTQYYTAKGKKAGRQIRHRWHMIFVPDEPEAEPEPLPKTLLPTGALLLTVIFSLWPSKKSRIVAARKTS